MTPAFEQFARSKGWSLLHKGETGEYRALNTQAGWLAWQAREVPAGFVVHGLNYSDALHREAVNHAHELLRRQGYHRDGEFFINVNRRGAEAINVITISLIAHAAMIVATDHDAPAAPQQPASVEGGR